MRKIGKFVFAALVGAMILACASCKTEDNSVSGATYKLTSATMTMGGVTTDQTSSLVDETVTFNSNGTVTMKSEGYTTSGTWTQDGNTVSVTSDGETVTLTVSDDGSIFTITISETYEGVTYSSTMTYTRQ